MISLKRKPDQRFKTLLIIFISLIIANCSNSESDRTRENPNNLQNNTKSFIYNMIPENSSATISEEYSEAINSFSINLLKHVYGEDTFYNKNLVISPFSISRNLSVIAEGASGNTKTELLNALGGEVALNDAKAALSELLYADKSIILQCADALWIDSRNYKLKSTFRNLINSQYGVEISGLDFSNISGSVYTINNWIKKNTNNRINNFLKESDFKSITALLLTNAMYFEADWASPFDISKTRKEDFITPEGVIKTDMMTSGYYHETYKTEEYENARLYYGTSSKDFFYLDVYMPINSSIEEFIEDEALAALSKEKTMTEGGLKMPKFFFESEVNLIPALKKLGINSAFDPLNSELPEIVEAKNLFIQQIKQKSGIKTDEEGTEAYTITVSAMGVGCSAGSSPDVTFNSPFVYFIRAGKNGLVLFSGVVNNPNN